MGKKNKEMGLRVSGGEGTRRWVYVRDEGTRRWVSVGDRFMSWVKEQEDGFMLETGLCLG